MSFRRINYCAQPPIQISNATSPLTGDLGNNIFRNNIIVAYGWNGAKPGISFGDPTGNGTCGAACQGWALSSTFDHNLFWQSDGLGGTTVLLMAANKYTCSNASTVTAAFSKLQRGRSSVCRGSDLALEFGVFISTFDRYPILPPLARGRSLEFRTTTRWAMRMALNRP